MSLQLSPEQIQFRELLRSFFEGEVTSEYRRNRISNKVILDPKFGRKISEIGLASYFAQAKLGGTNKVFRELSLLAYEAGRALCPEHLTMGVWLRSYFLGICCSGESEKELRSFCGSSWADSKGIGEKESGLALTFVENQRAGQATFSSSGQSSGDFRFVPSLGAKMVAILDQTRVHWIKFDQISSEPLDCLDLTLSFERLSWHNLPTLTQSNSECGQLALSWLILVSAEIAGACSKAVDLTASYVKERKQFDVPIGGFQAVQHKLADMYLACEAMSALSDFAAWAADFSPEQLELAAKAALSFACENGAQIIEGAIQLHGGIGFTWEYDLHLYLRRVKMLESLYGSKETDYLELVDLVARS